MIKPRLLRIQMNRALYVKFQLKQIQNIRKPKILSQLKQCRLNSLVKTTKSARYQAKIDENYMLKLPKFYW
ncbi:MAG: hypothetical protein EBU03_00715 [Methylophilaceae bacterium]|nr:hypothetical protein [Methylophilaceae bacterium]NCA26777.1 hypothetical protein [Methylophilaceae bacterium]